MNSLKQKLYTLLTIVIIVCALLAGALGVRHILADNQSSEILNELRASAEAVVNESVISSDTLPLEDGQAQNTDFIDNTTEDNSSETSPEDEKEIILEPNPYHDSFTANSDMAAWLQVPDTNIDYPIMWTPEDETYYLYRSFDKKENQNGSLILDTDSSLDPLTTNLIIHGHNMRSGAMFGNLTKYEKSSYYEDHKQIILYTKDRKRTYEIISVFRSQVYKKTDDVFKFYKFFDATTQEEFDDFYDNIKELSIYDTGVTASFGDHFITLSTCVYHVTNGRFVVIAKEVEDTTPIYYQP